jgi:hypothetical protein
LTNDFAAGRLIGLLAYADLRQSRISARSVGNLAIRTLILEPDLTVLVIGRAENDDDDTRDSAAQQHVVDGKTSRRSRNDTTNKKLLVVVEMETAVDAFVIMYDIVAFDFLQKDSRTTYSTRYLYQFNHPLR